jgi:hypothetical protein
VTAEYSFIINFYNETTNQYMIYSLLFNTKASTKDAVFHASFCEEDYRTFQEFIQTAPFAYKLITPIVTTLDDLVVELSKQFPNRRRILALLAPDKLTVNPFLKEFEHE